MAKSVEIKGGDKLAAYLKEVSRKVNKASTLRAGFLEDATYPDGTSVAMVAAMQNFGTSKIPPRPFFTIAVAQNSPQWPTDLAKLLNANGFDSEVTLTLMGFKIVGEIQDSIVAFDSVPLSPKTIAAKGFDKQLVDTGQMLRSVGSEVT